MIQAKGKNYIFFLGGYDAEMFEIREILIQYNLAFFDKKLSWGAKASDYKIEINNLKENKIPVLIELQLDIPIHENVIIVDHHNDAEEEPSSIEQIAKLLHIKLNRWQHLIAANDKGFIPAMENICATKEEIKNVRRADRKAQGVADEDEKLAEEAIEKNKTEENGITIIKALTNKFSPITDRLYGKADNLLIYTDDELTFYGNRKKQIIEKYKNLIDEGKAYYGGKDSGFFGIGKGSLNKDEILKIKDEIVKMKVETNEKLYSHHIFLFPFKWRKLNPEKDTLEEKFDVEFFRKELGEKKWKPEQFKLDHYDHYNEYNYFYTYVREILYDLNKDLDPEPTDENLIKHFEYETPKDFTFNIKLCGQELIYNLDIDSILLNVYRTGTAVLSFHLRNHKYPDKGDILKINKFGRRLYVPFFDLEADSIYTGENDNTRKEKVLCMTKKAEIPDALWIGKADLTNDDRKLYEDFEKFKIKENIKYGPFLLPKFIEGLFPENFISVNKQINPKAKIYIYPVLDDRMHVVSWYGNTELVNELNKVKECNDFALGVHYINDNRNKKNHYSYELSEWWYSYIFADTSPMHTDRFVKQKLLKEQTYSRWVEHGTLFGVSRFSFVMLTSSFSDLENYGVTFLVRHLQTMYYKMAELCLLQRATVLSFSDEVTHVSNLIDRDENDQEKALKKIEELYKHYILFINKIYFREVTAQEQGIEIYNMMQSIMRLPNDVKDLDNEISELNQFASMIEEQNETKAMQEQTKAANKLTKVATLLLIPTLIAGLLGMNVLPEREYFPSLFLWLNEWWGQFWTALSFIVVFTIPSYFLIMWLLKLSVKNNKKKL